MKTIKLAEPWTYRTPEVTIEFEAGEHQVSATVAEAAPKEKRNVNGHAKAGSQVAAVKAEG
jgi:hypothetical protein